jgi:hypothetical protein
MGYRNSQWGLGFPARVSVDDGVKKCSNDRWKISRLSLFQMGSWLAQVEEEDDEVFGFKHFEFLFFFYFYFYWGLNSGPYICQAGA